MFVVAWKSKGTCLFASNLSTDCLSPTSIASYLRCLLRSVSSCSLFGRVTSAARTSCCTFVFLAPLRFCYSDSCSPPQGTFHLCHLVRAALLRLGQKALRSVATVRRRVNMLPLCSVFPVPVEPDGYVVDLHLALHRYFLRSHVWQLEPAHLY